MTQARVLDKEKLYRNVRSDAEEYFYDNTTSSLIIESKAFLDCQKEPSVDRAKLKNFDPEQSRKRKADGIVTLVTQEVRQIGNVVTHDNDGQKVNHAVDVNPDPILQNASHARIVVNPSFLGSPSKKAKSFKLLRKALARLATQSGWTLEPGNL